jgi:hypothetical protein
MKPAVAAAGAAGIGKLALRGRSFCANLALRGEIQRAGAQSKFFCRINGDGVAIAAAVAPLLFFPVTEFCLRCWHVRVPKSKKEGFSNA